MTKFHLTQVPVVLITKEPILVWAIKRLANKNYPTRQPRSQYTYQTITTISSLWEVKSGHGHQPTLTSSFQLLGEQQTWGHTLTHNLNVINVNNTLD